MARRAWAWAAACLLAGCSSKEPQTPPRSLASDGGQPNQNSTVVAEGPPGGGDWAQYRHDAASSWVNPGAFAAEQVASLHEAWTFEVGQYSVTQPIVAGGTVYLTTAISGRVLALDAATGQQRWARELNHEIADACSPQPARNGFWSSVAVSGGEVYAASADGNLYALDPADGHTRWSVRVADPNNHAEYVQTSPAVALGRIYLGVSSTFGCDPVDGRVLSVDATSHALTVTPLVRPGQTGAPVWASLSVDEAAGTAFATTGDNAHTTLADAPLAQAIVSFDARTLSPLDHWQDATPVDDADFGAPPTLFAAPDGTTLVAAPNKDGWLYVWRRGGLAAGPLWKVQLAQPGDPVDDNGGLGSLVGPTYLPGRLIAAGGKTPDGKPGSVQILDPLTGAVLWTHTPPGYVLAGMPAAGDILVVASAAVGNHSGAVEILDSRTGAVLRTIPSASAIWGAPVIAGGQILWANFEGHVTALRADAYFH